MKPLRALCLAACAAFVAGTAQAQTTTESEEFSTGKEPEIQVGQTYSRDQFDDWEMICQKTETGADPCELAHLVVDQTGNAMVDLRIFPLPPGQKVIAGSTFVAPLGIMLQNGVVLELPGKESKQYPFQFCNQVGCVARIGFTPLELEAMRKGETATVTLHSVSNPNQGVSVPISLKGFATGYAALVKAMLELQKNAQ